MTGFEHDTVVPFRDSKLTKKQQVAEMFDRIAFRYDFLNRFLSAGIDVSWRRKALKQLVEKKPKIMLDVATGTADMAIMACELLNPEKVVGIDISEKMLSLGREKLLKVGLSGRIELQVGDSETINFPDNSFDAITVAFGVRNFEDLEKGISELHRVLKPDGDLVILEFSKPKITGIKQLYNWYLGNIAPAFGKIFCKNKDAYQYLNDSVQHFPERQDFLNILNNAGFTNTSCKNLSFGICSIYCGVK
jgi:demethylmenaquinone methyltransferase/2-methoxy-6-polyprenyl-1,4-benzoquinol methylase